MRRKGFAALLAALVWFECSEATGQERQSFEVTSVRVNRSGGVANLRPTPDGSVTISNHSLFELIQFVFGVRSDQIIGAPDWAESVRFDIVAKGGPNLSSGRGGRESSSIVLKLRSLLEDRFGLTAHSETRERPVFELLVRRAGTLGPQFTSSQGCDGRSSVERRPDPAPVLGAGCGLMFGSTSIRGRGASIAEIARVLGVVARRPVVDRTGLQGAFDVQLQFRSDALGSLFERADASNDSDMPSLFTAVEEQLGLRLRATRGAIDVIVVDAAQVPEPD
jgi:uncharacterized protein (TIGR03435 family)